MVADQSSTDHGGVRARRAQRVCEPHVVPRGCNPAQPRQHVVLSLRQSEADSTANASSGPLVRFSLLLEAWVCEADVSAPPVPKAVPRCAGGYRFR